MFQNTDVRLDYPDGYFEGIILCALLSCIPDYSINTQIISEANRLLSSDGIIHVVEFCSHTGRIFESGLGIEMHYQKPDELREVVKDFSTELKFEVTQAKTMSGNNAEAVNYWGRKIN